MAHNSRFALGVHLLVLLAEHPESIQTSSVLAASLYANPMVIRRILFSLQKAGLIVSQKGRAGGSRLAKPPKAISMADIYKAVETSPFFYAIDHEVDLEAGVSDALKMMFLSAKRSVIKEFTQITLAQVVKDCAESIHVDSFRRAAVSNIISE